MTKRGGRAVCTRFAPSPNGPLHVGHARTGVFNWILARQRGGRYFVRFERTDRPREAPGARASMVEDLEWLGLLGEEDPHDQVDLVDHHRVALNRLVEGGYTYADGDAVRFRVPAEGSVGWDDVVRGPIEVANEDLDNPVLVRSSGAPTFFLASTADDSHDQVSDLIRPDVLLRASAKQLHIWEALGHRPPRIGHHPLMKRLGGQNVTAAGYGSVQRLREAGIHRVPWSPILPCRRSPAGRRARAGSRTSSSGSTRGGCPDGPWPSTSAPSRSSIGVSPPADDCGRETRPLAVATRRSVLRSPSTCLDSRASVRGAAGPSRDRPGRASMPPATAGGPLRIGVAGLDRESAEARPVGGSHVEAVRTRLTGPVIGCGDAWELAEFYAALLSMIGGNQVRLGRWPAPRRPVF